MISKLFDTGDFPARWHCGDWSQAHGWTHIISDVAIFGAYMAIPIALVYFISKRDDVPFPKILWLFAAFILSCGIGHLIEASIFWQPWYRLSGAVKAVTATVSWLTVIALLPVIPKALSIPGIARLNEELKREVEERKRTEEELKKLTVALKKSETAAVQALEDAKNAEQIANERANELRISEAQSRAVIESAPSAMIMVNEKGEITLVNSQMEQLFGFSREELLGQGVERLVPERFRGKHGGMRESYGKDPKAREMGAGRDLYGLKKDGSEVPIEIGLNPLSTSSGQAVLASIIDNTERKRNEAELEESVKAQQILLNEIHHRVKNNLQIVASLLNLQSRSLESEEATDALGEAAERVRAMATVHETLYQGGNMARLSFDDYLQELGNKLHRLHSDPRKSTINIDYRTEPVELLINQAIPSALAINEMIVNCFKYAFPDGRSGTIAVELKTTGDRLTVAVSDDGVGLPSGFDSTQSPTLGMELIHSLARQLKAEIQVSSENGTRFALMFEIKRDPAPAL